MKDKCSNKYLRQFLIIIVFPVLSGGVFAQNKKADSLIECFAAAKHDTTRVASLYALATEYSRMNPDSGIAVLNRGFEILNRSKATDKRWKQTATGRYWHLLGWYSNLKGNLDSAQKCNQIALGIWNAQQSSLKPGDHKAWLMRKSATLGNMGVVCRVSGDYPNALNYFLQAYKLDSIAGNKAGMARHNGNLGVVYQSQGDYTRSVHYLYKALKIDEELGNNTAVARHLTNLGNVHFYQNNYSVALENYRKALLIRSRKEENITEIATSYSALGMVFAQMNLMDSSVINYNKAIEINKQLGNKIMLARDFGNLGNVYWLMKQNDKALEYYLMSAEIEEETGYFGQGSTLGNIGGVYMMQKKFKDARRYLLKAIFVAEKSGDRHGISTYYETLSKLDSAEGNFKNAFEHYKVFIAYRDSVMSEENTRNQTRTEMQYEFDKKAAAEKAVQEKKDALAGEEKRKQAIILWSTAAGLILVLIFSLIVLRSYRQKQKANREIARQKAIIEEKQKEILDSIHYAGRIQRALITSEKYIARQLNRLR